MSKESGMLLVCQLLLEGRIPSVKDEEGAYFVDRDGEYFKPILSFLRTRVLTVPEGMSEKCIQREAQFYMIPLPGVPSESALQATFQIRYNGVYTVINGMKNYLLFDPDGTVSAPPIWEKTME